MSVINIQTANALNNRAQTVSPIWLAHSQMFMHQKSFDIILMLLMTCCVSAFTDHRVTPLPFMWKAVYGFFFLAEIWITSINRVKRRKKTIHDFKNNTAHLLSKIYCNKEFKIIISSQLGDIY